MENDHLYLIFRWIYCTPERTTYEFCIPFGYRSLLNKIVFGTKKYATSKCSNIRLVLVTVIAGKKEQLMILKRGEKSK